MQNFIFKSPTEFVFGKETENQTGNYLKKYGAKKVLVLYGGKSAKASGLLDRVTKSISENGIEYIEMGAVQPNPVLSKVHEGIELCRKEKVDFLLAVGGGSVIDTMKAIGIGIDYPGDVWDYFCGKASNPHPYPGAVVLTIPAAGSEGSKSMVITNEDGLLKRGFDCEESRSKFSILNPEITYTLPAYQTACGATDMMSHIMERYFTNTTSVELTDRMSEAVMKTIIHAAPAAISNPCDYNARADLMWASTLAHSDLLSCGKTGDWASHDLEHELSALYGIAHGAGLAVVTPAWMKYVYKHDIPRFCQFASRVFDVEMDYFNPEETALAGIRKLEEFLNKINMPTRLPDLGITDNQFELMAAKTTSHGTRTIGNFMKLSAKDCSQIYELMK